MTIPAARVVFTAEERTRILELVDRSLVSGSLTLGPLGDAFEGAMAKRHRRAHAVATSSGTAALEIVLRTLDLAGAEVVVPANTFFATAAAVVHAGGRVRFADADPGTLGVSVSSVAAALTPATAAVIVVHVGGVICPDMEAIADLCARRGVVVIEDAAHAVGSSDDGHPAGTFSRAAIFSFYPTKILTSGEGGMIVTDDAALAGEARVYRDQGKASFLGGGHVRMGAAWRMSEVHAAIGLVHLDHLDDAIAVRRAVASRYDEALRPLPEVTVLEEPPGSWRNGYKYPVLLDAGVDHAGFRSRLAERGIALSGKVYATPLHREPVFAGMPGAIPPAGLGVADDVCARHVCLPVHSDMTVTEADQVVDGVVEALATMHRGRR
jgi:perosamine synthetase